MAWAEPWHGSGVSPQKEAPMPSSSKAPDDKKDKFPDAGEVEGNSLKDASDEAVRFMEEGDEPGHAGHGDGG
jgi:hypothetical protein